MSSLFHSTITCRTPSFQLPVTAAGNIDLVDSIGNKNREMEFLIRIRELLNRRVTRREKRRTSAEHRRLCGNYVRPIVLLPLWQLGWSCEWHENESSALADGLFVLFDSLMYITSRGWYNRRRAATAAEREKGRSGISISLKRNIALLPGNLHSFWSTNSLILVKSYKREYIKSMKPW